MSCRPGQSCPLPSVDWCQLGECQHYNNETGACGCPHRPARQAERRVLSEAQYALPYLTHPLPCGHPEQTQVARRLAGAVEELRRCLDALGGGRGE